MQGDDDVPEVLVLTPTDVDMTMHEGREVRVEGTLDLSTSRSINMLLLSPHRAVEETVLLCDQSRVGVFRRRLVQYFTPEWSSLGTSSQFRVEP
jgi:hypothetical protein